MLPILAAAVPAALACIGVDQDRILAGHLAVRAPAFAGLPPETEIALAPAPGSRRILGAAELRRLAMRHGLETGGTGEVCFERTVAPLEKARLEAALRAAWADRPGSFELLDYSRGPVPGGDLEFRLDGLAPAQPGGGALWRGRLRYGSGRSVPVWARVRMLFAARRVVAARNLAARSIVEEADLRIEEFRGPPPAHPWCGSVAEVAGRMLRRAVRAGQPIDPRLLAEPPDVERGSMVEVAVRAGAARLEFRAKAESGGRRGDWILVRNPESGKRFRARVEGRRRAVVEADNEGRRNNAVSSLVSGSGGAVAADGGESESRTGERARPLHPGSAGGPAAGRR